MGSMVVGFSSAYTSPALVSMQNPNITSFEVTDQHVSGMEFSHSNFPHTPTSFTNVFTFLRFYKIEEKIDFR
jgi:hypothetical protein